MRKIVICLILGLFVLQLSAQKTQSYQPQSILYSRAMELYDKEKYNAAIEVLEDFKKTNADKMMLADANFYISACKLKLSHDNAESLMLGFIEDFPYSSKLNYAYFLMANFYFQKPQYSRAIKYFKEVEINGITKTEEQKLRFEYGYALFKSNKFKESKMQFYPLTVKDDNSYYVLANYYYGYVSYMNEDYDEALKTFKKVENSPGIPNTMLLYIAQIQYIKGEYSSSLAYCDKVNASKVLRQRDFLKGKNNYQLKNYKEAAVFFQSANFSTDSLQSEELYELGNTYYQIGNCNKAITYLRIISNEGNAVAQAASYSLGDCFIKLNQKDKAENAFFEAQRTDFDKSIKEEAMFQYAKLSYENGKMSNALSYFKKHLETYPSSKHSAEVKGSLADIFLETKDYATAISILESIENKDKKLQETYQKVCMMQGKQKFADKKHQGSEIYFQKSLSFKIDKALVAEAYYWLAESNYIAEDYNTAINYYKSAVSSNATGKISGLAHYGLGYSYFKKEDYNLAIQNFNKYKTLSASFSPEPSIFNDAVLRIGDAYLMLGAETGDEEKYNIASENYAYISSRNVKGADYALYQRGLIYGLIGKRQEKIATLKRIPTEFPKSYYIPDALYETGSEQADLGLYKDAERNFMYLIQDYKGTIYEFKSHFSLGVLYYNNAEDNKALEKFKYVAKNYPNTGEAKSSLGYIENIYNAKGQIDEYENFIKTVPNYSKSEFYFDSLAYRSALTKYQESNYKEAIDLFGKYISKYKNGIFMKQSYYYRANSYEANNNLTEAIADYKFVADAQINEFTERSIYKTAKLSKEQNDANTALIYYGKWESLVKNNKDLVTAIYEQMRILHAAENIADAKPKANQLLYLQEATEYMKGEANLVIGKSFINDSLLNTAINSFDLVSRTNSNQLGAEAHYLKSWCYFELDSLEKTKKEIIEFNKKFSGYDLWLGKSLILLSDYYVAKNDDFSAKSTLNSVLANFDDERILSVAREKLAAIERNDIRLNNIKNLAPSKQN